MHKEDTKRAADEQLAADRARISGLHDGDRQHANEHGRKAEELRRQGAAISEAARDVGAQRLENEQKEAAKEAEAAKRAAEAARNAAVQAEESARAANAKAEAALAAEIKANEAARAEATAKMEEATRQIQRVRDAEREAEREAEARRAEVARQAERESDRQKGEAARVANAEAAILRRPGGLELMQKLKHAGFVSTSPSDGTPASPDDAGSGGTVLNALPRHLPGVAIYS